VYERVRESYDRVAEHYAAELGDELATKPVDRALLRCLAELVSTVEGGVGEARIADIGCGPGHVAGFLAGLGLTTIGIDISPVMIEIARQRVPTASFRVGTLLAMPATDGELAGAAAFYSLIHLRPEDRPTAYSQLARAIVPGGWLLLAFHISLVGRAPGEIMHVNEWWGQQVDLDFYYVDPAEVIDGLSRAGFTVMSRTDREPWPETEHASRRCYLLCQRSAA
jgi:SAM-dependent methyltransferase